MELTITVLLLCRAATAATMMARSVASATMLIGGRVRISVARTHRNYYSNSDIGRGSANCKSGFSVRCVQNK
jgi:hypothetical protein